jgi:two-component system, NarL family, response regulator DesR
MPAHSKSILTSSASPVSARGLVGVMCVDDNATVVDALRCRIELEQDMRWLGHLLTADALASEVIRLGADVILLDLDMPGKDPLSALAELASACPQARAIMLSGYVSEDFIDRAIDAGAWGYVAKSEKPEAIIAAVRRGMAGQIAFGPDVTRQYLRTPPQAN